jgi:hypothetical protein
MSTSPGGLEYIISGIIILILMALIILYPAHEGVPLTFKNIMTLHDTFRRGLARLGRQKEFTQSAANRKGDLL